MITLEDAKKAALRYIGKGLEICQVSEITNAWIFVFRDEKTKQKPVLSPVMIYKENGKADVFFPPDHKHELASIKIIEKLEDS